ncbi:heparinase II/III family protein [Sutcliffiella halmapala]|uniref:heparinase II/III family protein n=1 Tax=Sutcliffiella halmapala TaxID=79882 RepID=UPI000995C997|nr:heparinase II/III-family protein [Sutcliffiella halmapala]
MSSYNKITKIGILLSLICCFISINYIYQTPLGKVEPSSKILNKEEIKNAQLKAKSNEEWSAFLKWEVEQAEKWLTEEITIPSQGGGHPSWFICKDGSALFYNPNSSKQHFCEQDQHIYIGDSYDHGWLYRRHQQIIQAAFNFAHLYLITENPVYGEKAREILVGYSEVYSKYPLQSNGGRLYWQSLDEAVSLISLVQVFDIINESGFLSYREKTMIKSKFFKESAQTLMMNEKGTSNWQAWHIAAIGMIGYLLEEEELIEYAVNGEQGFFYLIENSVTEDGFWHEGSIAYHLYALRPLTWLAEYSTRLTEDSLFKSEILKKMIDAPIQYAYPDHTVPTNNNGGIYGMTLIGEPLSGVEIYELASNYFQDARFGSILNRQDSPTFTGLFYGPIEYERNPLMEKSINFSSFGHGILRNARMSLLMDYGFHGGYHGHFDKLHLDFYALEERFATDPGAPAHSHPLFESWYKQTISHNTVTINGESQLDTAGDLILYSETEDFNLLHSSANDAYPGVTYERSLWLNDLYTIDWFYVEGNSPSHVFDWVVHVDGNFSFHSPNQVKKADIDYDYFTNGKTIPYITKFKGSWNKDNNGVQLNILGLPSKPVDLFLANTPGPSNDSYMVRDTLLQRYMGKKIQFTNILYPTNIEGALTLDAIRVGDNGVIVKLNEQYHLYWYRNQSQSSPIIAWKAQSIHPHSEVNFPRLEITETGDTLSIQIVNLNEYYSLRIILDDSPVIKKYLINGEEVIAEMLNNQILLKVK